MEDSQINRKGKWYAESSVRIVLAKVNALDHSDYQHLMGKQILFVAIYVTTKQVRSDYDSVMAMN